VNAKNDAGNTPLHYAAINNRVKVARLLLENKADANAENRVRARSCTTPPSLTHQIFSQG
jgi:ankyrin repeat protein